MATDYKNEVQKLYVAYFSRPADVAGLNYWTQILSNNPAGYELISHTFATSPEYQAAYAGMNNAQVVNAVYEHLFSRDAEAGGLAYWTDLLDRHVVTVDNVVRDISKAAVNQDKFAYDAKVAVAGSFTSHLDLPEEQKAYAGANNKLAIDYVANVKDLVTAANGMDPGNIDSVIAKMVATPTGADGSAQIVGIAEPDPLMPPLYF
jgi:hypothetical protein